MVSKNVSYYYTIIYRYNVNCSESLQFPGIEQKNKEGEERIEEEEVEMTGYNLDVPQVQLELPTRPYRRVRTRTLYGVPIKY